MHRICSQDEKAQLESNAAAAADASTAERSALMQQLEAKTSELGAACAQAEATAAQLAETVEARDRAQQECAEHAEYQESLEGVVRWDAFLSCCVATCMLEDKNRHLRLPDLPALLDVILCRHCMSTALCIQRLTQVHAVCQAH